MNKESAFSERLNLLDAKLDKILELLSADTENPAEPDALGHLTFLDSLTGKSEIDDYEELVALFRKHGIEPGDIRKDSEAWCGKGIRLALVAAGHEDPGEKYNRACNWQDFGVEAEDPEAPGVIVVYWGHVSCRTKDGGEIGCNVGNSVKVMPAGQNWFGTPIAHRKIA